MRDTLPGATVLRRTRCLAGTYALAAAGCSLDPYACFDDGQCQRNGQEGTCEASGFCSYPDEGCESGSRYSPNAGGGRAGQCVEAGGETATSDGTDPTSETTDTSDSSDDTGGQPMAELKWSRAWQGDAGARLEASDLALRQTSVLIVGNRIDAADVSLPWVAGTDLDGIDLFEARTLSHRAGASAQGATGTDTGFAIVGAGGGEGAGGQRAWALQMSTDGTTLDEELIDTLVEESFAAVAMSGDSFAAVGRRDSEGWIRWFDASRSETTEPTAVFDAAASRGDGVVGVAGSTPSGAGAWRLVLPGGVTLHSGELDVEVLTAIAFATDGSFLLAGRRTGLPFVAQHDADGTMAWAKELPDLTGTAVSLTATGPGRTAVVAVTSGDGGLVAGLDGGGTLVWQLALAHDGTPVTPVSVQSTDGDAIFVGGTVPGGSTSTAWLGCVEVVP